MIVYISKHGQMYHKENCYVLQSSDFEPVELSEDNTELKNKTTLLSAFGKFYRPCPNCCHGK